MANQITHIEIPFVGMLTPRGEDFLLHFGQVSITGWIATFTLNNQAYSDSTSCARMLEAALQFDH